MAPRTILVVLGKQGAGKGTQCARLADAHHIPHVSTGDILRAAMREGSELGLKVKSVVEAGELVSDDLIMELVAARLEEPDAKFGALLDGCTRTIGQAEALDKLMLPESISLVVNIDVPTDLVLQRLSSRRVCQECGTIYSENDPAAISGTCEKCGGDVIQRQDDTPDAISHRLAAYERDTAPLLDYYRDRGMLVTVNGDQAVDLVTAEIEAALTARGVS